MSITITDSAVGRINSLLQTRPDKDGLRILIAGGGCGGYQYKFAFENHLCDDDKSFTEKGAKLYIDNASFELMDGSIVDFVDGVEGSYFDIRNPVAKSSCGCGASFSCDR